MSATIVDGGPAGPDEAGGQYRNRILTDRTTWWEALGSRQGIIRGFDVSTVAGQMAVELSAGLAAVEERDVLGATGTGRGYTVWSDAVATASFGAASASDRNDALVIAFVDVGVGTAALGTETSAVGGQVVVVPGVSGTTTPRTDTQISAAVGSGGWFRVADVLVESTDTEINPANITLADSSALTPAAELSGNVPQAIANNTTIAVAFAASQEIQGSLDFTSNTTLEINQAGFYQLAASVRFASNTAGVRYLDIRKNGTKVAMTSVPGASNSLQMSCAGGTFAEPGDTFQVTVLQNSGGSLDLADFAPTFSAVRVA